MGSNINASTSLLGLIGHPVEHSLSPVIHNYIFQKKRLNAVYLCFDILPRELRTAVESIKTLGIAGVNVTIPYKEKIIKYLNAVDKTAEKIGAVNTIINSHDKLTGYNTDILGFILSLRNKVGFLAKSKKAVVLGAGGAAKAVCCGLAEEGISSIGIYDIDIVKSKRLVKHIADNYPEVKVWHYLRQGDVLLEDTDILVNATGVGLHKKDKCPLEPEKIPKDLLVYDLIYNPSQPVLLKEAKKRGAKIINGIWMLIYQGLASLNIWFGKDFSYLGESVYRHIYPVRE